MKASIFLRYGAFLPHIKQFYFSLKAFFDILYTNEHISTDFDKIEWIS